ncbi:MAG: GNAT family N-acetyltransferase [Candidatus Kariarchaeaceae archaeon]
MDLEIVPLTSMKEAEEVAEVQRQAWEMSDIGIVPTFETRAVADVGFVYVAKIRDHVIGFIYGYHHFPDIHYSHMMAVLPEYQSKNVGYRLKRYHRERALESKHHVRLVQWTVDPLLPNNAYLNFAKLGGYCDTYKVDYYGDPDNDGVSIYAGVPTDRFKFSWPIHSARVTRRMQDYRQDRVSHEVLMQRSPAINVIKHWRFTGSTDIPGTSFTVEVPANYQEIRTQELDIARDWRVKFRDICLAALDSGFILADYHHVDNPTGGKSNYFEFILRDTLRDEIE